MHVGSTIACNRQTNRACTNREHQLVIRLGVGRAVLCEGQGLGNGINRIDCGMGQNLDFKRVAHFGWITKANLVGMFFANQCVRQCGFGVVDRIIGGDDHNGCVRREFAKLAGQGIASHTRANDDDGVHGLFPNRRGIGTRFFVQDVLHKIVCTKTIRLVRIA